MDTLNLTQTEVQNVLQQIEKAISKSQQIMTDLDNQMKQLKNNWTGDAAEAYEAVFRRFKKSVAADFEALMRTYSTIYNESAESLVYNNKNVANMVNSSFGHK